MAPSPKSSLATLLIISSIDLLLCSFTMAVMLFLIFQPSQRSDRGSAITQASSEGRAGSQSLVGEHNSPAIIVVENLSQAKLTAVTVPAGFRTVDSSTAPGRTLTFVAFVGQEPSSLILETQQDVSGATEAQIAVAAGGILSRREMKCDSGGQATVHLGDIVSIDTKCREGALLCSHRAYPVDRDFSIDASDIDFENVKILLAGPDTTGQLNSSQGGFCLASPKFDDGPDLSYLDPTMYQQLATMAKNSCQMQITKQAAFASQDEAQCIFSIVRQRAPAAWRAKCFPSGTKLATSLTSDRANIMLPNDPGSEICSQLSIVN